MVLPFPGRCHSLVCWIHAGMLLMMNPAKQKAVPEGYQERQGIVASAGSVSGFLTPCNGSRLRLVFVYDEAALFALVPRRMRHGFLPAVGAQASWGEHLMIAMGAYSADQRVSLLLESPVSWDFHNASFPQPYSMRPDSLELSNFSLFLAVDLQAC